MINLEKKTSISLTKQVPGLNNVRAGLSWDSTTINGKEADADVSVFMLNANSKIPNDGYFVFYNNLRSADGAITHNGDARDGAAEGDDESINITLSRISPEIEYILLAVSIHNADEGFNFGNTRNASVRLYNQDTNQTICEYRLTEQHPNADSIIIGSFYRGETGEWKFEAMVNSFQGGLQACLDIYS
jgi:tellurium resistance protein TerD